MKIMSITGVVSVSVPGLEQPIVGLINSDASDGVNIEIQPSSKHEKEVLHRAVTNGDAQHLMFLSTQVTRVIPNDAIMVAAMMDKLGVDEFRLDMITAMSIEGQIEVYKDESTMEHIIRRVRG